MKHKLSEFDLINKFSPKFSSALPDGVLGIGDDCAVLPYSGETMLLITTDTLIDEVHFLSQKMPYHDIAYKSLVVNLSDIAAMGGKPSYVLLSIAVPKKMDRNRLDSFFSGLEYGCKKHNVCLIGGDTTKTEDKLTVTITVLGFSDKSQIKYRSTAKRDDYICVTGVIGDSVGGLHCYLDNLGQHTGDTLSQSYQSLKQAHLCPRPHLEEGRWLAGKRGVNAMIDISDGIESDIKRITEASLCGAEIELDCLPLSKEFSAVAEKHNWDKYELAATGGEDYCLLVTVAQDRYKLIRTEFEGKFGFPLTAIGRITSPDTGIIFKNNGTPVNLSQQGYDHFR